MDKYLKILFTYVYVKKGNYNTLGAHTILSTKKSELFLSAKAEYVQFPFIIWKRGTHDNHYIKLNNKVITTTSCPLCLFAEDEQVIFSKLYRRFSKKENCEKEPFNIDHFWDFFKFPKEQGLNAIHKLHQQIYSQI